MQVGKLEIHYLEAGSGEPLLILHGGGGGARSWIRNAGSLAKHYTVYIPDLPGFGGSQSLGGKFRMAEYVQFVENFTSTLGLSWFNLMGHSIGGNIALNYALKFAHRVKGLVLVSSWGLGREVAPWIRLFSHPVFCDTLGELLISLVRGIKWLCRPFCSKGTLDNALNRVQIDIGRTMVNLQGQKDVLLHRLAELIMPTLLVWGGLDLVVSARHSHGAAALIHDCQVHVFPMAGHSVYRQKVDEFSKVLRRFLKGSRQSL